MKLLIKSLFFYFILIQISFAYCDFSNLKFGFKHPKFAVPSKGLHYEKIFGEHICFDKEFYDLTFQGEFLDGKLISANLRQSSVDIDMFDNIVHFYGEPTVKNASAGDEGLDYYYWNLYDKQIILKYHKSIENTSVHLVIAPNNYLEISEKKTN